MLEFIHERGNPIVEKFKSYLVQLSNEDPYWNDSVKTKTDTEYICDIAEIPNCITEAYERKGILFSFMNADYDHKWVSITCDKKRENVRNFTHHAELKEHLKELGLIMSWDSNSFFVNSIGYKFEVRFNEEHHNRAHFHLSNADEQISLSIPDADVLAGKVSNQPKVISWSLQNMKYIVELWNKYHPDRSV